MLVNANTPVDTHIRYIFQCISFDTLVILCRQKLHVVLIPFGFFSQKFFMLPVRQPDNNAGPNVDSAIYTHIISVSKLLSSHTLAVFREQ
jgi:hypothetical protein